MDESLLTSIPPIISCVCALSPLEVTGTEFPLSVFADSTTGGGGSLTGTSFPVEGFCVPTSVASAALVVCASELSVITGVAAESAVLTASIAAGSWVLALSVFARLVVTEVESDVADSCCPPLTFLEEQTTFLVAVDLETLLPDLVPLGLDDVLWAGSGGSTRSTSSAVSTHFTTTVFRFETFRP